MLESHVPASVVDALAGAGHRVELQPANSLEFGSSQIIQKLPQGGYIAGSDPRRDGQAVGF
jgi:gamma-glutamyltranspeptidase/glutathione hydrolase